MLEHKMKAHVGVAVKLQALLISTLDGGERLASCHGRYTPGESDFGIYGIARCVRFLCQSGFFWEKKDLFSTGT